MTEVRSVRTDPNSVGESARRQVRAQTLIDDLDERRDILDVVTRYAAADCKNAETLGRRHQLDKHSAVALKIDQNWSLAAAFTLDVVDIEIVAQLRVHKRRHKDGHAAEIGGF